MAGQARLRWRRILFGAIVVAASVVALACGVTGSEGDQETATPTALDTTPTSSTPPEAALRLFVQRRLNLGFVTSCAQATRPEDVGKHCARLRGERDGLLAFELGPTFAPHTRLIILERVGDAWTIVRLENVDTSGPGVPGIPWPLRTGANVVVAGTTECLRVRDRPGMRADTVACLENGTPVTIVAGPVVIDTFEWWQLEGYGWSASNWLRYLEEAPPEATPAPEGEDG